MTAKVTPMDKTKPAGKPQKPKEKKKKTGKRKLQLKGTWLKTPADWARFEAWAKINALPRKVPEPESISRASKPLWKMKKHLEILSKPAKKPDQSDLYRFDVGVSKKALKAKASKRLKSIAKPLIKPIPLPREFPVKIKKSTLNYKATENIIKISQPKDYRTEECKTLEEDLRKLEEAIEMMEDATRKKNEKKLWATLRQAMTCRDLLTPEQINQLITEGGVYRTAFVYEFTPWMEFLSLPPYRALKLRKDDTAKKWKEYILSEIETRGRRALEEQIEREEKRRKLEEEKSAEEDEAANMKEDGSEIINDQAKHTENELKEKSKENTQAEETEESPEEISQTEEVTDKPEEVEEPEDTKDEEKTAMGNEEEIKENGDLLEDKAESEEREKSSIKTVKLDAKPSTKSIKSEQKPKPIRVIPKLPPKEDDEESKKKRAERNAWRFEPPPWKDDDPLKVKESALKGPVSPRMAELAQHHVRKDTTSRKNPFKVQKTALTGPIPKRMVELAKPAKPKEPVNKPPPRERNQYNQPIYPMPPYGKKMPKVKPYKEKDCKPVEDSPKEKAEETVESPDPIAFKPTIDPYFDPDGAQRQLKARKDMKIEEEKAKNATNTED